MDNAWIIWTIQGIAGLAIGALCFFMKRTLQQLERQQKEQQEHTNKIEEKLNDFISGMPLQYTLRDDFIRALAGVENKLEKILDKISEKGG